MNKYLRMSSIFFLIIVIVGSCGKKAEQQTDDISKNEHLVMSVLYLQKAAEARALYYQAYNIARFRLQQQLETVSSPGRLAVVVDIDETVLNNTPYEAKLILTGESYPTFWESWVNMAEAKPVPGALEFLKFADKKGVNIFYVSNRKDFLLRGTLQNLKKLGFPQADEEHIMLREKESSKEPRRKKISKSYDIALFIGDNLNDFSAVFERLTVADRFAKVDSLKSAFGTKFIVLPNPMYGEWEAALYDFDWSKTAEERRKIRYDNLEAF